MKGQFWKWGFWFKPFGKNGIRIELDMPVYHSERYGYRKVYRLWGWAFEFLPPWRT